MNFDDQFCNDLKTTLQHASTEILRIRNSGDLQIKNKTDHSPVTIADKASHEILISFLQKKSKALIISEENDTSPPQNLPSQYWLIDPLDGTKDFIAGHDTYTINIAYIQNNIPIFGALASPSKNEILISRYVTQNDSNMSLKKLRILASRSAPSERLEKFMSAVGAVSVEKMGSAYKFMMIANNKADLFIRFGPTHEWDTAAGQALVEAVGGVVVDLKTRTKLAYSKTGLLNSHGFLVATSQAIANHALKTLDTLIIKR